MYEFLVTDIHAHMRHVGRLVFRGLPAKEHEVAGYEIAEVWLNVQMQAFLGLLGGIAWNYNVVLKQDGANETAAIQSLSTHSAPHVWHAIELHACRYDACGLPHA